MPLLVVALLAKLANAVATSVPDKLLEAVKVKPPTVMLCPVAMALKVNKAFSVTLVTVLSM